MPQVIPPPPRAPKRRHRLARIIQIILAIIIAGEVIALAYNPETTQALTKATTHQAEEFTELYFSDPTQLPHTSTVGETAKFRYHITNQQTTTTTYRAYVTVTENGVSRPLQTDTITLKPGTGADLTATFKPTKLNANLKITITLPAQHQSIHFSSQPS